MLSDIFLIRHAAPQSYTNVAYRTMPGPDLSEQGRQEAQQVAAFLANKSVDHLFVSPFARTTQTAEAIVDLLDLPVTFSSLVQETAPNETDAQVLARIQEFLRSVEDSPLQRIGVVTHGHPIQTLIAELSQGQVDLSQYVFPRNNPAPTAGVWHARRGETFWDLELVFQPRDSVSM